MTRVELGNRNIIFLNNNNNLIQFKDLSRTANVKEIETVFSTANQNIIHLLAVVFDANLGVETTAAAEIIWRLRQTQERWPMRHIS